MDDVIVINHSDESEEDERRWTKRKRPRSASPAQIIDLTVDGDVFACVTSSDENVIDLTVHEDDSDGTFRQQMSSESKDSMGSPSEGSGLDLDSDVDMNVDWYDSKDLDGRSSASEDSSICSTESITGLCQQDSGVLEGSDKALPAKINIKHPYVMPLHLQDHYKTIHNLDCGSASLETGTQVQQITSSAASLTVQKNPEETLCSPSTTVNKSLLYKLRHFKKPPVTHLLPHSLRNCKNSEPTPMPLSRMNIVNNTKDESFHQGTLYFMSEFVSASHYPPKDLISHVITSILLGAEEQTIRHEAYMILMKVQRLHPATSESVAWEWKLLSEVMSKQENQTCHLFLQYVVQTIDDDFHLCLQRRTLHKCLCKSLLSCDKSFFNVKQVIHWVIDAVKQIPETDQDPLLHCNKESPVFLLQRMLSIAVEVDNYPTTNSNKIADYIFPYVTILKTRKQKEMFFKSTENILLRAKILELVLHHNCELPPPPELSLCFGKILYFISNTTLQLENQDRPFKRWDEMLHHIIMLSLSLQTVITGLFASRKNGKTARFFSLDSRDNPEAIDALPQDWKFHLAYAFPPIPLRDHLRTPVIDRQDEIIKRPQCLFYQSGAITESEVDRSLSHIRTSLGAEPPASLLNRLFLLQSLLYTAVKRYN